MNIVYFGSDVFLSCFEYFVRHHRVLALYTYHNDEDYFTEYAITRRARELGIPVHYESITPADIKAFFRSGCELFFSAEYNRIIELPQNLPQFRGVNVHSSCLPQGRSYYPIECAMERELSGTGVTLHTLAPKVDSGRILAQRSFPITAEMDSVDVYLTCARYARALLEELMGDFDRTWASARYQGEKLPYWRRSAEERLTLTHAMSCEQASALWRCFNSMTQVELAGSWYYVTALMTGTAALSVPERRIAPDRWLYGLTDGHLRLNICPIPKEEPQ